MALFKKYRLNKKCLMEDWQATDEVEPLVQKMFNGGGGGITKEDVNDLLQKVLVKKTWLGKTRSLTDNEVEQISVVDKHKYAADFFFRYMKKKTDIAKIWNGSAKKLLTPLPKSKILKKNSSTNIHNTKSE